MNSSEQHLLSAFQVLLYGRVFSHVLVLDPSHVGSKDIQPFDIVTQCCHVQILTQELCDQVTKKIIIPKKQTSHNDFFLSNVCMCAMHLLVCVCNQETFSTQGG